MTNDENQWFLFCLDLMRVFLSLALSIGELHYIERVHFHLYICSSQCKFWLNSFPQRSLILDNESELVLFFFLLSHFFPNHRTKLRRFICIIHFQFGMTLKLIQCLNQLMDVIWF